VRLTINGETVSYSLENERSLGEVVKGVQSWLAAAGFLVTELRADGRDLLQEQPEAWGDVALVQALDVKATHTGDMKIAHWQTVDVWFGMLAEELGRAAGMPPGAAAGMPDPLEDLLAGLPQILEGFTANPFLPPGSDMARRFEALWKSQGRVEDPRAWPAERREEAAGLIRDLRAAVRQRMEDATHPKEPLARRTAMLRDSLGDLREVSLLLQTGRDKAAMDIMVRFTDVVQSLMDLLPFLPPDPERARLLTELTPVLRDLVSAFDAHDAVLIGDLLEYEVAPRMERITPLLEKTQ
jgi:hypothetical protein